MYTFLYKNHYFERLTYNKYYVFYTDFYFLTSIFIYLLTIFHTLLYVCMKEKLLFLHFILGDLLINI